MIAWWVGWAAPALALIYLIFFCWRGASVTKTAVKTGSVALLAVFAALQGAPGVLIAALAFCALGDLLLSLDKEPAFLAGVGAFAAGHVGFVAVILMLSQSEVALLALPWRSAVLLGLLVLGAGAGLVLWRFAGALRWAVVCYVPIILSMGIAALTLPSWLKSPYRY